MMRKVLLLGIAVMASLALALCACGGGGADGGNGGGSGSAGGSSAGTSQGSADADFTAVSVDKSKLVSDLEITGMKMGKTTYAPGDAISVTLTWKGTPAGDAWVGIVPADVAHGSEAETDQYDVDYRYLVEAQSGATFTFEGLELEPGKYTMRVHDTDAEGVELAWCSFTVK